MIMAYRNWQWFPTFKMSTNKTLMDLAYVAIPPKESSEWLAVAEDKMVVTLVQHHITPHVTLKHFIDVPTFHVLAHAILLSTRHFMELALPGETPPSDKTHVTWTDYKGTDTARGVISNRLSVTFSLEAGRKAPWILAIEEGPGTKTATGAVMPKRGETTRKVLIYCTTAQIRALALMGLEQSQAQTTIWAWRHQEDAKGRPDVTA